MISKRGQRIIFIIVDIIIMAAILFVVITSMRVSDSLCLNVYFGESHDGMTNIAQLYYAANTKDFSGNDVITEIFYDNMVSFNISEIDFKNDIIRLDPFNMKREFTISGIELAYGEHSVFKIEGDNIKSCVDKIKGMKSKYTDDGLYCQSKKDNPRIIFKRSFSDRIYKYFFFLNRMVYLIAGAISILLGIIQIIMLSGDKLNPQNPVNEQNARVKSKGNILAFIITEIILASGVTLIYALHYFEGHFGQVPFGQLVYHLHTPLDGTDVSSYKSVIIAGVVIVTAVLILNLAIYIFLKMKDAHLGYLMWITMVGVILVVCAVYRGIVHFDVIYYYIYTHEKTTLYEDYYADARDVSVTFPEKKRNLIYIFLESMEMTFSDSNYGGAMKDNLIPNLSKIAMDNECFSDGSILNGAHHVSGATYTMGALAAQTCGVSINEALVSNETLNGNWESENNYLPGVWAIGDVLKEQGYNQEFLIGSKGEFAGRSSYFKGHGGYAVEDYTAAIEGKRIPDDYKVWWGYEDEKLFQFAKEDILKLSKEGEPFNFTMLTVDTHFTDGYKCELCDDKYDSQYSNVIACSDGQVAEFIEWVEGQDFYDNTTIVICGDHLTPDSFYINAQGVSAFDRRTYTAVINPADGKHYSGENRVYTTLDMYPTTLSAMGVKIEGDRLGLGVDLYSDTPTLAEQYGLDYINTELLKNSDYYTERLLYK